MNNQQRQQVLEQIRQANNVLVAVSTNPTVDELTASVGLTLMLNKLEKHATTVFSGMVPSTIEFLQPEKTIETTTDSLRDFIIALDKSKADKLRYKVEDDFVRIFITPYQTSITEKDLQFSQGDFNVDLVLAVGVTNRDDLDKAITAHGRILHDATVATLTVQNASSDLGTIKWHEDSASSLSEMIASLMPDLPQNTVDGQTATSLLTGIISETDRFRNQKTSPYTLTLSGQLMAAGANQQLIAEKLEQPEPFPEPSHIADQRKNPDQELADIAASVKDGELDINHENDEDTEDEEEVEKIHIDEHGNLGEPLEAAQKPDSTLPLPKDPDDSQSELDEDKDSQRRLAEEQGDGSQPISSDSDKEGHPGDSLLSPPSAKPMMSHEKVIMPPSEDEMSGGSKPFDLQQAMEEASANGAQSSALRQNAAKPGNPLEPVTIPPHDQDNNGRQESPSPTMQNAPPFYNDNKSQNAPSGQNNQPQFGQSSPPLAGAMPISSTPLSPPPPPPPPPPAQPQVAAPWTPPPVKDEPEQEEPQPEAQPEQKNEVPDTQTLVELEQAIGSKHILRDQAQTKSLSDLEDAVAKAADAQKSAFPTPTKSVGASNVSLEQPEIKAPPKPPEEPPAPPQAPASGPSSPPPVPPPMTPQFFDGNGSNNNPMNNK